MADDREPTRSFFVANVRELRWQENELGASCEFDKHRERFPEFGVNLTVLQPGQPMTMYHRERYQEGFLVLRGECLLIVEGREVQLRQWDYFHCPPDVPHAIVGAGTRPSLVLAVGNRIGPDVILYPRDETALKHGAGVERDNAAPQRSLFPLHETGARHTLPGGISGGLADWWGGIIADLRGCITNVGPCGRRLSNSDAADAGFAGVGSQTPTGRSPPRTSAGLSRAMGAAGIEPATPRV